jgi:hypothetical protein
MLVLEDWWPTIRDLTLYWVFCRVQYWKRQYERCIKVYMPYDEEKKEKSWRSLMIKEFLFYLSPRSSVLSRGCIGWVGEVQNIKIYLQTKVPRKTDISEFLTGFQKLLSDRSDPAPAPQRLSPSQTYLVWKLVYKNSNQTCLAPSPDMSVISTLSRVKAQNRTCSVP